MTEYKMTDEMRKKLTKFLEEKLCAEDIKSVEPCLEEVADNFYGCAHLSNGGNYEDCEYQGHRTLTTDADMMAVFRKIRDVGKLRVFVNYVCCHIETTIPRQPVYFMQWLFLDNPERACCLAAMWLEEQE